MRILAVETSCDESAVAIIEMPQRGPLPRLRVLANVVASQAPLHARFGGVVPHLAKLEHQKNLVPVFLAALKEAKLSERAGSRGRKSNRTTPQASLASLTEILAREPELLSAMKKSVFGLPSPSVDAIAVTVGPGLAPALWVGVNFARALACLWGKPVIPVNHLEGHIYTNLIPSDWRAGKEMKMTAFAFPALALIVSGGHTELVLMRRLGDYRVIGETLDDAAGEAFDKVAKMLGLGFPGGPVISRLAERGNNEAFDFPRPMLNAKNFDFSFSGLKTAVLYALGDIKVVSAGVRCDVAASFEQAAADVLVAKTIRAARENRVKTIMIGGGVAANKKLRAEFGGRISRELPGVKLLLPDVRLTGDNALMIALAGWFGRVGRQNWRLIGANANLRLGTRRT